VVKNRIRRCVIVVMMLGLKHGNKYVEVGK